MDEHDLAQWRNQSLFLGKATQVAQGRVHQGIARRSGALLPEKLATTTPFRYEGDSLDE